MTVFSPVPSAQTTMAPAADHRSLKSRRTAKRNSVNMNSILPYLSAESNQAQSPSPMGWPLDSRVLRRPIAETTTSQDAPGTRIVCDSSLYYPPVHDRDVRDRARRLRLVRRRADLPERRVPTALVVEHFDVLEQLVLRVTVTREVLAELALDRREEALHDGIVPTVATPAHAADDAARIEDVLIVRARVRAALVGVMQ